MPMIMVGVRGICYAEIEVTGPPLDLHSGTWGGIIENPALARILAALKNPET